MRKIPILIGIGLSAWGLSLAVLPAGLVAQQVGDAIVFLVPSTVAVGGRDARQVIVVTGKSKGTTTVNCKSGDLHRQDADLLDSEGQKVTTTEVAVLFPEGMEVRPGARLGAFRPAGECGSDYVILHGYVLVDQ